LETKTHRANNNPIPKDKEKMIKRPHLKSTASYVHKTESPLVSIIVRTIGSPLLQEALHSISQQTYPNLEIVLVNAGRDHQVSQDKWCGNVPVNYHTADCKLPRSKAANLGLSKAKGEFLAFLDEDDLLYPDHIANLVKALQNNPDHQVAYSGIRIEFFEQDGTLITSDELNEPFDAKRLQVENYIPLHAVLFSRNLLNHACSFDEELDRYEDWDFWLQLSLHTKFFHVPYVTACYRNFGRSGFGYIQDDTLVERSLTQFFNKWSARWSGEDFKDILEYMKYKSPWICSLKQKITAFQDENHQLKCQLTDLKSAYAQSQDLIQRQRQLKNQKEYEISLLQKDLRDKDETISQKENEIKILHKKLTYAESIVQEKDQQIEAIFASHSWQVTAPMRALRPALAFLFKCNKAVVRSISEQGSGLTGFIRVVSQMARMSRTYGLRYLLSRLRFHIELESRPAMQPEQLPFKGTTKQEPVQLHTSSVDIIICVHNALEDVQKCFDALLKNTNQPYSLIIVDDGSDAPTRDFLQQFVKNSQARLLRNTTARGYTYAANQGLKSSSALFVILLNSDTLVTPDWLDRMVMCAQSDPQIGLVGPLSNKASWQSIPEFESNGDWADNPLPQDLELEEMAGLVAQNAGRLYPGMPFLNGFCLLIKQDLIQDIGFFDEENFGQGYGEENDYCLRARSRGWSLALADDVYIFHAHSKSYSDEKRKELYQQAQPALEKKHDPALINAGVFYCRKDRVLEGLRARARHMFQRRDLINQGRALWQGRRVVFVLPVTDAGGGSNVILNESFALVKMGIEVTILNFEDYRQQFQQAYPNLSLPVTFVHSAKDIPDIARGFDAAIATFNPSVEWLTPLTRMNPHKPILGYYIQDFEPNFYPQESPEYRRALESYTSVSDMVLSCKTQWNKDIIKSHTGRSCHVIRPSFNLDLFRPEPRQDPPWPERNLRIVAMVRPSSQRRNPQLTMQILEQIKRKFGEEVEIIIFGEDGHDPQFKALPHQFAYKNLGKQHPEYLAQIFNESDIFVDFSTYQAMGLTGMEAMGCGLAVVMPQNGGVHSYARNNQNALFADTSNRQECEEKLEQLIVNNQLRNRLQEQALRDIVQFYPEIPAFNMMQALFSPQK
jgi:GT2 family glycosyltransferase